MPRRAVLTLAAACATLAGCGSSTKPPHTSASPPPRPSDTTARRTQAIAGAGVGATQFRAVLRLAKLGHPVYCGGDRGDMVALTFDDGPGPYTHYVLKRLRRNRARATFFLTSRNLPLYGKLVPRELEHGTLGDHTVTHPFLPGLSDAQMRHEVDAAQEQIGRAAGFPITLFRPPYEGHDAAIDRHVTSRRMLQILWNVDSGDSLGANYAQIQRHVDASLRPGAIVLMHDNRGQTVRALPPILHAIRRRHLRAVTVPELMASDPPTARQLRAGPRGCRGTSATGRASG